jgi:hypothetical protein
MRALTIAALLLAAAGTAEAAQAGHARAAKPARAQSWPTARQVLDSWEKSMPFLKQVDAAFPAETLAQAQIYVDKAKTGASDADLQPVAQQVAEAMTLGPRYYLATAPTDKLVAYAQAATAALKTFKTKSDHACAFADAEIQADPPSFTINPMTVALVAAMKAGRDTPAQHGAPLPADMQAYSQGIYSHLSPAALDAMRNPTAPRSDAITCEVATASFASLSAMQPEAAARVMGARLTAGTHPAGGR